MPVPREKLSSIRPKSRFDAPGHKPTAPWAKESLGSRSKAAGFVPVCTPRPSQAGHQPKRTVEGEIVRRQQLEASPALLAGEVLAVDFDRPVGFRHVVARLGHVQHAAPLGQGVLHAAGDTAAAVGPDGHAVDDHFDAMLPPPVDLRRLVERVGLAVDPHADVSAGPHFFPEGFVLLADLDFQRGHEIKPRARRPLHDLVDDLVGRLRADRQVAAGTVRLAESRDDDPQVIVNLGDRADRAAGRVAGVLLLDGDGRRKALDVIQPRLLHLVDELPGVGTEAFHVTPLAFGVDRIHGQRGLAAAAGTAADGHLVAGNLDVDALEVVLPGAADLDRLGQLGAGRS